MKITIENTDKIVELNHNGSAMPARVWQGATDTGIPVQVFVTRIAPEIPPNDPRQYTFESELVSTADPRPTVDAIPLRLVI